MINFALALDFSLCDDPSQDFVLDLGTPVVAPQKIGNKIYPYTTLPIGYYIQSPNG